MDWFSGLRSNLLFANLFLRFFSVWERSDHVMAKLTDFRKKILLQAIKEVRGMRNWLWSIDIIHRWQHSKGLQMRSPTSHSWLFSWSQVNYWMTIFQTWRNLLLKVMNLCLHTAIKILSHKDNCMRAYKVSLYKLF